MGWRLRSLMTNALKLLSRYADLGAALAVVIVVVMLIIPLPSQLLDLMIVANICAALTIVVTTMFVPEALDLSSFPSLLLLTTTFRLAINVSVTRLILLHGDAGSVIHAFGEFVVGGNLIIGLVIFLILVIIQFVVITNGAGRVAEVAARFTLDAMPGKQIAIDADLNAGLITEDQAQGRRKEIMREADLYGALDGASKFTKGDAIVGLAIVAINLVGGIAIGMLQKGMSLSDAAHTYSLLTVGDGIAAQIPALLIAVATGLLVTRAASDGDLGSDIVNQFSAQPKAMQIAGGVAVLLGLIPGLPMIPFVLMGGILFAFGRALAARQRDEQEAAAAVPAEQPAVQPDMPAAAVHVDPLELAIGFGLVPMADASAGGGLQGRVKAIRKQVAADLGTIIPPVRIHDDPNLESHAYVIKIRGAEAATWSIVPGHLLAIDSTGQASAGLPGIAVNEPSFGLPAVWIDASLQMQAEAAGYKVVDAEQVVITHFSEVVRRNASQLLTRQETRKLLDALKADNAAVVEEVIPERLSVGEVQRVLQQLLGEGVSIRDLSTILEAIGDRSGQTRDPGLLAEFARQALARQITQRHLDPTRTLRVLTFSAPVEQELAASVASGPDGEEALAIDPERGQQILGEVLQRSQTAAQMGYEPVLLCSARIRRHLRKLIAQAAPLLPVISYNELPDGLRVETVGQIS